MNDTPETLAAAMVAARFAEADRARSEWLDREIARAPDEDPLMCKRGHRDIAWKSAGDGSSRMQRYCKRCAAQREAARRARARRQA